MNTNSGLVGMHALLVGVDALEDLEQIGVRTFPAETVLRAVVERIETVVVVCRCARSDAFYDGTQYGLGWEKYGTPICSRSSSASSRREARASATSRCSCSC